MGDGDHHPQRAELEDRPGPATSVENGRLEPTSQGVLLQSILALLRAGSESKMRLNHRCLSGMEDVVSINLL
jgi:hypothetical protein